MCFMQGGSRCLFCWNCCNQGRCLTCLLLKVSVVHLSPSPRQDKGCGDYSKLTMVLVSRFRERKGRVAKTDAVQCVTDQFQWSWVLACGRHVTAEGSHVCGEREHQHSTASGPLDAACKTGPFLSISVYILIMKEKLVENV